MQEKKNIAMQLKYEYSVWVQLIYKRVQYMSTVDLQKSTVYEYSWFTKEYSVWVQLI